MFLKKLFIILSLLGTVVQADSCPKWFPMPVLDGLTVVLPINNTTDPVFTSTNVVFVNENQTSALTLKACAESMITFSLSGTDASSFDVQETSGVVTFKTAPDFETKNTYSFTVTVTDSAGNAVDQAVRVIILDIDETAPNTTIPVISMNGLELIRVTKDEVYADLGAIAIDDTDGAVAVITVSNVDTSTVGNYTVTYDAMDSSGNSAIQKIRRVEVVESQSYSLTQDFEGSHTVQYWARSSGMEKPVPTFTYDHSTFTQGTSSLHIQAHIAGLADTSARWYYYLRIPISPEVNVEGELSFSGDVMVDEATAGHVKLGFNKKYYPIAKSGILSLPYINQANQWVTIQRDDLSELVLGSSKRDAERWLYDGTVNDIGVAINYIGIFVFGKGPLDLDIHLDNFNLSGTHTKPSIFQQNYLARWDEYITRVRMDINDRNDTFSQMISKVNTNGINLCTKQQYLSDKLDSDYGDIDTILDEMYTKNSSATNHTSYFPSSLMEDLDMLISRYDSLYPRLVDSLGEAPGLNVYKLPAMKYNRLNGYDIPSSIDKVSSYNLKMTRGEYKSIAMLIDPMCASGDGYTAENTDFIGDEGSFAANNLDTYISKIWYQAGLHNTNRTGKFITQELLLKDEELVRVDFLAKTNELRVTNNETAAVEYINVSNADAPFPDTRTITFNDSNTLQPFKIDTIRHKLLWSIIHIPEDTLAGNYTSIFKIKNSEGTTVKEFPIHIEVLPFDLNSSRLTYSLYYTGDLVDDPTPIKAQEKSAAQQLIELKDMKEHGVLYPTSYDKPAKLAQALDIRNSIGLPKDKFYSLGVNIGVSADSINNVQAILEDKGYDPNELYVYAIDEASTEELQSEIDDIIHAHDAGAKVFTAGYFHTYAILGDYLDQINFAHGTTDSNSHEQVTAWHNSGKRIFTYSAPQVGVENPEAYRRNFGCKLWKQGFDGAMDWAYQYERGAFWNDFDGDNSYREETFTYPTTNGLVGTIEWEGYRDAITDVRYISTLENLRDKLASEGTDVSALDDFIQGIDCSSDLYILRKEITNKILEYR